MITMDKQLLQWANSLPKFGDQPEPGEHGNSAAEWAIRIDRIKAEHSAARLAGTCDCSVCWARSQ